METHRRIEDLVDFIAGRYRRVAEIGIGLFPDVAYALLDKGVKVFATDVQRFRYSGLEVFVDDIMSPNSILYAGVDLVYSMRPPPELVPYMSRVAMSISCDLIVKMLSSEYPESLRLMKNGNATFFICNHKRTSCV